MPRFLYTLLFYLLTPIVILRLLYRSIKAPAYRQRIGERFGFVPAAALTGLSDEKCIWLHAVSVGETIAAVPLVKQLQQRYPQQPIVVTTMTPTGSERVKALLGDSVYHIYAPYDLPDAIARVIQKIRPSMLVIMETELWPNTIAQCWQKKIPVLLANARLSEKSASGYQRLSALTAPMLGGLSAVVAQNQATADRFLSLGLAPQKVVVSGSIKFDVSVEPVLKEAASALKTQWSQQGQRFIIIAASTRQGEDEIILQAYKQCLEKIPELLLILVPRHPERFQQVATMISVANLSIQRRSQMAKGATQVDVDPCTQVLLGDSMGELMLLYGCADIAFVGGSLVATGGHNMLEPAAWGLPVMTGPSNFNFEEISALLQNAGALTQVADGEQLQQRWLSLAADKSSREQQGNNARQTIAANSGALERLLAEIDQLKQTP